MANILQTFSNTFSYMKITVFWSKFHWSFWLQYGPIKKLSPSIMLSKSIMWIKEKQTVRYTRGHFVYASSQWKVTLQCNFVTHWLDTFTKWSLSAGNLAENPLSFCAFFVVSLDKPLHRLLNGWWRRCLNSLWSKLIMTMGQHWLR